jgi:hypothetical protein
MAGIQATPTQGFSIGDILAGINRGVEGIGTFVGNNKTPLLKTAMMAQAIGDYAPGSRRTSAFLAPLLAQERGGTEGRGLVPVQPATPAPVQAAPIQAQGATFAPPPMQINPELQPGSRLRAVTQNIKYEMDPDQNGIPGDQRPNTPIASTLPKALATGPQGIAPVSSPTGGEALAGEASPSPVAPVQTSIAPQVAPVQQTASPTPSVQNLTEGDFGNYGYFGGNSMDLAKTMAANSIERDKLGPATTTANASYIKAMADLGEYGLKQDLHQLTKNKTVADTDHAIALSDELRAKRLGTDAYSPLFLGKVEQAKESVKAEIKKQELIDYMKTPMAALTIPRDVASAAGLNPSIKTYGQAAMAYGSKDAIDKISDAYVKMKVAHITAGGVIKGQELQTLNSIKELQQKDRDQALAMVAKLSDPKFTLLMQPTEKVANEAALVYWQGVAKSTSVRIAETESMLMGKLDRETPSAGKERRSSAGGGAAPIAPTSQEVELNVGGKVIKGVKISDTQAKGEDGKLYNITAPKK